MRTFVINYVTLEGGRETDYIEAESKERAILQLKRDYGNVREILRVTVG